MTDTNEQNGGAQQPPVRPANAYLQTPPRTGSFPRPEKFNTSGFQRQSEQNGAQPGQKRGTSKVAATRNSAVLSIMTFMLLCFVCVVYIYSKAQHNITVGDIAQSDIKAPIDVEDIAATNKLRENASDAVEELYYINTEIFDNASDSATRYLDALSAMRYEADTLKGQIIEASERSSDLRKLPDGALTSEEWQLVLNGAGFSRIRQRYAKNLSDGEICDILALSETQFNMWLRDMSVSSQNYLRWGVSEEHLSDTRNEFVRSVLPTTPITVNSTLSIIAESIIVPTLFYDEEDTQKARQDAQAAIAPVIVKKGEVLIKEGEPVTAVAYQALRDAGYALTWLETMPKYFLLFLFYVLLFVGVMSLSPVYVPTLYKSPSKTIMACVVMAADLVICFFLMRVSPVFNTSFIGPMLITQLVSSRAAIAFAVMLAPTLGFIAGGTTVDFYCLSLAVLMSVTGCVAGIYVVRSTSNRSSRFFSGIVSGLAMSLVYALLAMLHGDAVTSIFTSVLIVLVCNTLTSVVGIGVMPVFETVFNVSTPARLLEIATPSHPLLKRLMLEAPGTYNHSMMVATLCENAATAIDANVMLVRAGAYFHDIGKLKRPLYFTENQTFGENPHETLNPETSAAIIIAHVRDGVVIGQKAKLPTDVLGLIAQHHGTTLTAAFFNKAAALYTGDGKISEAAFRYPGPRPITKEAAILMICDSCEAAVRSLKSPTPENVSDMIEKVVKGKIDQYQFGSCPLSFSDINALISSMKTTFKGILHERVEYPDVNKLKEELHKDGN